MKKILTTMLLAAIYITQSMAYNQVRLVINDGTSNKQLKRAD